MLLNYFVSEVRQSASQNLSKKDGAVKTVMFFSERFCEADWHKFRNKEAARWPTWLTDGINGSCLCTLIFSVLISLYFGGLVQGVAFGHIVGWVELDLLCSTILPNHFCQLPFNPSRTRQVVEEPKSKSNQPSYPTRCPSLYLHAFEFSRHLVVVVLSYFCLVA